MTKDGVVDAPGHMPQLDGLRALAALAVVVQHTWGGNVLSRLAMGSAGVRLFFVLSGFLITGILLRASDRARAEGGSRRRALGAFYARRALRIFPLGYLALVVAALLDLPTVRESFVWHAAYLTNAYLAWWGELRGPLVPHWSLAVEEQFYLAWPAIVLFVPRSRLRRVIAAMVVLGPMSRALLLWATGNGVACAVLPTSCLDTLGAGAWLALRRHEEAARTRVGGRLERAALGVGLALFAMLAVLKALQVASFARGVLNDTAAMLISAWLVDRAADGFRGPGRSILEARPLVALGTISYGLYVYHNLVLQAWFARSLAPGPLQFVAVIGVTIPMAAFSWQFYEKPLRDRKRDWPYVRSRMSLVGPAAPADPVQPAQPARRHRPHASRPARFRMPNGPVGTR